MWLEDTSAPHAIINSSLTRKYQFLEVSDKPYTQMFNFQTISFSSNPGGGVKYTTLSIYFRCKKPNFIWMELHVHLLDVIIMRICLSTFFFSAGR